MSDFKKEVVQVMRCPKCGADVTVREGETVAECEYCNSTVNIPLEPQISKEEHKVTPTESDMNATVTKKRRGMTTRALCYTAVLTAISAVCNIFTVVMGGSSLAVSFTYVPNFIAGAFFGPVSGFLTGILGDLIGCWIAPKGDINPIILVASGLLGLIPGVVFRLFRGKNGEVKHELVATIVSMLAVLGICTVLNTIGLYLFYFKATGRTLAAVFALRMPKQILVWAINFCIVLLIRIPIAKLLKNHT